LRSVPLAAHVVVSLPFVFVQVKKGIKYDDPKSAKQIPAFIMLHRIDASEVSAFYHALTRAWLLGVYSIETCVLLYDVTG